MRRGDSKPALKNPSPTRGEGNGRAPTLFREGEGKEVAR
jgi:hypothetical protein